jgi:hypothetical protein
VTKPVEATTKAVKKVAKKRPAETTAGTVSVVVGALVTLFGVDLTAAQIGAVVVLLGLVPAVVTWFKER